LKLAIHGRIGRILPLWTTECDGFILCRSSFVAASANALTVSIYVCDWKLEMAITGSESQITRQHDEEEDERRSITESGPVLDRGERQRVQERVAISAATVHEIVRLEGEYELRRHPLALAWSALAAGLSMGFSLVAEGLLAAYLPSVHWTPLVASIGYSVGFLIVILGRQQLFTENTLTVILPLLTHFNGKTLRDVMRLWGIVLGANIVGTLIFATLLAHTPIFSPQVSTAFVATAQHTYESNFARVLLRGVFAGWLIALMVWLLPAAEVARVYIIIILTYIVALGAFSHIIAGSVDAFYLVNQGIISLWDYISAFLIPTCLGNVIGGVILVALLNYAQVATSGE
jgi:formate-nitrite transporter family protein